MIILRQKEYSLKEAAGTVTGAAGGALIGSGLSYKLDKKIAYRKAMKSINPDQEATEKENLAKDLEKDIKYYKRNRNLDSSEKERLIKDAKELKKECISEAKEIRKNPEEYKKRKAREVMKNTSGGPVSKVLVPVGGIAGGLAGFALSTRKGR